MRPALPNPAWSNCALLRSWDAIEAHVGARMMPKVTKHTADQLRAIEYGHGAYGVVMPTVGAKGTVFKVTSDPTEAHFVSAYRSLSHKPEGIVKYGPIFMLPGTHQGRPLFAMLREEASDVGKVLHDTPQDREAERLLNAIFDETVPTCKVACSTHTSSAVLARVRESATRHLRDTGYESGDGPGFWKKTGLAFSGSEDRAGFGVAAATTLAKELTRLPKMAAVGRAILSLISSGIVVSDLHLGNFGNVMRNGRKVVAITDPGNVAFLTTKFDKTWPKQIDAGLSPAAKAKFAAQSRSSCGR